MSPAPHPLLTADDLKRLLPELTDIVTVTHGGQKQVFKAMLSGRSIAVKALEILRTDSVTAVDPNAPTAFLPEEANHSKSADESVAVSEEEPADEDPADLKRLRREVGILSRIDSPHVVHLVQLRDRTLLTLRFYDRSVVVFAEEFLSGQDVRSILRVSPTQPWPVAEVIRLGSDVTHGIKALWDKEVVHRDLSPANIMRQTDGRYVILDLGLALDLNADAITTAYQGRTPWYHAPEILRPATRNLIDHRADLFTLGIILFEALTGQHPFREPGMRSISFTDAGRMIDAGKIRDVELPSSTPERLGSLIRSCLNRDMVLRPRTCQRVLDELASVSREIEGTP